MQKLIFKSLLDNKVLVAKSTLKCLENIFLPQEMANITVTQINPQYMDGVSLFENYDIPNKLGVNCLICECKRNSVKSYVALLVPTGYKYNMSTTVRRYTNSRMVSVANLDFVLKETGMEYGSINPFGLPEDWKIFIDPLIMEEKEIICGSGLQISKIALPSEYLLKLPNAQLLENLAKIN